MDEKDLLFTETHEWVEAEGELLKIGISDHAQNQLGDIVYVELPEVGRTFEKGEEILVVESPKAAASIYAPVSGEIVQVNGDLESAPDTINQEPYGAGWLILIRPANMDEEKMDLLDYESYQKKIKEE